MIKILVVIMKQIKELTRGELQIMQILWEIESGFVNEIITQISEPKPAYNTVSTIVRILEKKGFVSHQSLGKTHKYYPIVSKDEYLSSFMGGVLNSFFSNSFTNLVSYFSKKEKLSNNEIDELLRILKDNKK